MRVPNLILEQIFQDRVSDPLGPVPNNYMSGYDYPKGYSQTQYFRLLFFIKRFLPRMDCCGIG